ncbi:MAG: XRE family transcriptional regulator [Bacteroides sp.]|nr:XRE family transcriptional regulator [Bacteroides sp.]
MRQIAAQLRGLREALELSPEDVAGDCGMEPELYRQIESGEEDISVWILQKIARQYGVQLDSLLFGEEPKMTSYFLTRAGKGTSMERTRVYKYQSLAAGFLNRRVDPFLVTVEPKEEDVPFHYNSHPGQEFNMVVSGRMLIGIGGKELTLDEGDAIYFDSSQPHGMKALDNKSVEFLAVII